MNSPQKPVTQTRLRRALRPGAALLVIALTVFAVWDQLREKEIALLIGEPWEDMHQRSSARISPAIREIALGIPKSDARLRFSGPHYGFVTPLARFFTIGCVRDVVSDVRMASQEELEQCKLVRPQLPSKYPYTYPPHQANKRKYQRAKA